MEANENKSDDPRWISLRVSRINLGLNLVGALLAFPVMFLLKELPEGVRLALALTLALSLAWDLRHILLKARDSVGAFRLFDLDAPKNSNATPEANAPRLGIHVRYAAARTNRAATENEGVVFRKAFVSPWFTALRYRLPDDPAWRRGWPRVIPIWPDSIDAEEFRKIRVALKWK